MIFDIISDVLRNTSPAPPEHEPENIVDKILEPLGLRIEEEGWQRATNRQRDRLYLDLMKRELRGRPSSTRARELLLDEISDLRELGLAPHEIVESLRARGLDGLIES